MTMAGEDDARRGVLLVEDDTHTRSRLARVIEEHPRLVLLGMAGSCAEARALFARLHPDVLLTDLGLPDGDGVTLIREARARWPEVLPLVITVFGDEQHVMSALEAGALGYLLKDGTAEHIGASIVDMLGGGSPISPVIARRLLRRFRETPPGGAAEPGPLPRLSEREGEVLRLIVKGFTYAEIADLLGVSAHTVTTHVRGIYRKLEVHSRGEAVYEALQLGLVKVDE
jgi:DNA-binding NarL/FixJ family response regulator